MGDTSLSKGTDLTNQKKKICFGRLSACSRPLPRLRSRGHAPLDHPLQDVDAVLQPGVFLLQLLKACRWVQALLVFEALNLCIQFLDLLRLTEKNKQTEKHFFFFSFGLANTFWLSTEPLPFFRGRPNSNSLPQPFPLFCAKEGWSSSGPPTGPFPDAGEPVGVCIWTVP